MCAWPAQLGAGRASQPNSLAKGWRGSSLPPHGCSGRADLGDGRRARARWRMATGHVPSMPALSAWWRAHALRSAAPPCCMHLSPLRCSRVWAAPDKNQDEGRGRVRRRPSPGCAKAISLSGKPRIRRGCEQAAFFFGEEWREGGGILDREPASSGGVATVEMRRDTLSLRRGGLARPESRAGACGAAMMGGGTRWTKSHIIS